MSDATYKDYKNKSKKAEDNSMSKSLKAFSSDMQTPHSIEAEQAVLGGLMLATDAWDKISHMVTEQDFFDKKHRVLFRAMASLSDKGSPLDVVTIAESLELTKELEDVGSAAYLIEIAKNTPSAANIIAYSDIVRQRSVFRQLIAIAHQIAEQAYFPNGKSIVEILDVAEKKIFEISRQDFRGSGPLSIRDVLVDTVEKIDKLYSSNETITGTSTNFDDLDNMTSGLQEGDLVIVAGRPSMGKTTFAMNIGESVALNHPNNPVLIFSMEMPADSLAMRMIASIGRIDQTKVRSGKLTDDDWPKFSSAVSQLSETKMLIDDTPALSPTELRSRARRIVKEHGQLKLIVIDYLQLMQMNGGSENRASEISEISRSLKALAKELKVPVIALSQLNRELEKRPNKRPYMSDLRESGAIEQDADLIIFIYRDEVYNEDSPDKGTAEIIIGKQRNGPIGTARLVFSGQLSKFENFAGGYSEGYNE
tara:strand:+ start:25842 stop:27278 length:1437 start_codon:yes stop_codon:yes gene_type:complete